MDTDKLQDNVGRVPSRGGLGIPPNAGSGDPAYKATRANDVGRVPPPGGPDDPPPRRLRRLHRVWPDRDGNISYLLTMCVDGRRRVLDNEPLFERFISFLLDGPKRYRWFGRRFVIMPDHIHLIAHMGHDAVRIGQWMKALKAVVGGLERSGERPVRAPGLQQAPLDVGRVPPHVVPIPEHADATPQNLTRIERPWRWQNGYYDHKFRTPESESRKWEYVCLNPVRAGLVKRPEEWPFGGEIFYDESGGPRLVRGTPPLLEIGMLVEEETPRGGTRPTT